MPRADRDLEESEEVADTGVFLAETFFRDLEAGSGLDRESLVEGQKADSELRQTVVTEGESERALQETSCRMM